MKTKVLLSISVAICSILFMNCASTEVADSRDVTQEKIYQSYQVTYNQQNSKVEANAVFRFGGSKGTTLILSDFSNVNVNGAEMEGDERIFRGYVYSNEDFDLTTTFFEFHFTDLDSVKYTNSVSVFPINKINIPDSIAIYHNSVISWEGASIQESEQIEVSISDNAGNDKSIKSSIIGANSITIEAGDINGLVEGEGNIKIIRKVTKNLHEGNTIGGHINSTCHSKVYPVIIGALPSA